MNEPAVTRGGPAGRRLAVGSQVAARAAVRAREVGEAVSVVRAECAVRLIAAARVLAALLERPATSALTVSIASATPASAARVRGRFTGTPRAGS